MTPRGITEQEWAETRRAGMLAAARLAAGAGGIPDVLLPYQKERLLATAKHAVTLDEKSRRIGATWGIGADAVLTASAAKSAGGMDTLYIGYNLDMAREFIDCCAMWARAFNHVMTDAGVHEMMFDDGNPDSHIQAFRIRFASGFEIVALSSRPRSLRGRQGYVIIDEAAFHDDLDELIKSALALLIWGGKVLVISTHNGEDNAFNRLIQEARAGRKPYKVVRTTFDDALRDGLYQRIALVTGQARDPETGIDIPGRPWSPESEARWRADTIAYYGEGADEELFCIPSKGGGIYLPRPLIEARMSDAFPVVRLARPATFAELDKERREGEIAQWCEETLAPVLKTLDPRVSHAFGEDFGRISDLTVIAPIAVTRTTRREIPFVVELRNIPFEQQKQVLFYVVDRLPRFVGGMMDATGNGAYLAEVAMQKYGSMRIAQVKLNEPFYLEHFPPFKAAFEDGMIVIPKDSELLDDLALVRLVAGVPKIPPVRTKAGDGKGQPGGSKTRHGDFAVAGMLAYASTRVNFAEYGYMPAVPGMPADPDEQRYNEWMGRIESADRDILFGNHKGRLW